MRFLSNQKIMSLNLELKSQNLTFLCSYAESVGAKHFETSAKNNIGVEELFLELTNMVNA